jgi:uncharacterized protein (TIGR00255 family)
MTGFGDARCQNDRLSVAVELRAVNNRYFKIAMKCPEAYAALEAEFEKRIRTTVARGMVTLTVRVDRIAGASRYRLNRDVLEHYWEQLHDLAERIHLAAPSDMSRLLQLPGAVSEQDIDESDREPGAALIRDALEEAINRLQEFRLAEGDSMQRDLQSNCEEIAAELKQVADVAPQVATEYRERLHARIGELLEGSKAALDEADLLREVSIFADRCDISEEVTRMRSHLSQFSEYIGQEKSMGRKLEFLCQEMFREVNTIGSKANNVAISYAVVTMKAAIEKMREVLQNVE